MADVSVASLKKYIDNDLNVLISGPAGTGKTSKVLQACEELGLKVKYYSAPTLDPYVDLIGVPVPNHDTSQVEFWRPKDIDDADVVIFDEINRAVSKTQNTVFEITQFGSINGEKLPNLKCVVAMINPKEDGYKVDEMDTALLDRFDIQLQDTPAIDVRFFQKKFGKEVARVAKATWDEHNSRKDMSDSNAPQYISPRRMDKVITAFSKVPEVSTITAALPEGVNISPMKLFNELKLAFQGKNPYEKTVRTPLVDSRLWHIKKSSNALLRDNRDNIIDQFYDRAPHEEKVELAKFLVEGPLATNVSSHRLHEKHAKTLAIAIEHAPTSMEKMVSTWSKAKLVELADKFRDDGNTAMSKEINSLSRFINRR